ncbi:MAG: DNA-binding protein [Deltaproteobacteria bacterium]|nr:DNA-binding protein [Deltaproteobacteria bacterium]
MKFSQAKQGRVFVIRLEDGEILHEAIENFARDQGVKAAALIVCGGVDVGSKLVVGPLIGRATPISPIEYTLDNVHECAGTGTLFPDEEGKPSLHMHIACGRDAETVTGCVRSGVKTWNVLEVILFELAESTAVRRLEPSLGFKLMAPY